MNNLEIVGSLLGIANVALTIRRSVWNYPFGLAMVALYAVIFYDARLYSDALLQIYFFVIQVYGWHNWLLGKAADGLVQVETLSLQQRIFSLGATSVFAMMLGWFFSTYTNAAAPWADAAIAAMSVTAQFLLSIRKIEAWPFWIAVDCLAIGLFFSRGLYPTTILYSVFLILAVSGFWHWSRKMNGHAILPDAAR